MGKNYIPSARFRLTVEKGQKKYTLSDSLSVTVDKREFFLTNQDYEGISMSGEQLFDLLNKFWENNF